MIQEIAAGFQIPDKQDLAKLNSLQIRPHRYGEAMPDFSAEFWLTYLQPELPSGHISFFRNCSTMFPDLVDYTIDFLSKVVDIKISPDRVNLMRSIGTILPHIDTSRKTAINIGLLNTSKGITRIGRSESYEDYEQYSEDYRIKEGHVYAVNVSNVHSVIANPTTVRLSITIAIDQEYSKLVSQV